MSFYIFFYFISHKINICGNKLQAKQNIHIVKLPQWPYQVYTIGINIQASLNC